LRDGLFHHEAKLAASGFVVAFYGDVFRAQPQDGIPKDRELLEIAQRSGLVDIAEAEIGPGGLEVLAQELGAEMLRMLVHQLARYFADPTVRAEVQRRLEATVTPDTRVIVAHSMGSVVAYEALCRHPEWSVTTLVTLGSPLGGPFVGAKVEPPVGPDGKRPWPGSVQSWTNVAALGDPAVADPDLAALFAGPIEDVVVNNGHRAHDAEPYLNSIATGLAVSRGLRS